MSDPEISSPLQGSAVAIVGPVRKDIPVPPRNNLAALIRARLKELEIGDSFETALPAPLVHYYAKRVGIKVTTRRRTIGCEAWRVE